MIKQLKDMAKQAGLDEIMIFISEDKDGISVNWKKLADFKDKCKDRKVFERLEFGLVDFLKQAGILVYFSILGFLNFSICYYLRVNVKSIYTLFLLHQSADAV